MARRTHRRDYARAHEVTFADYGPPKGLRVAEAKEPHPGEGQIRIAVRGG
jgi:NADPH:quinone reductase-like Zn-dependent oxidoreductase